MILTLIFCVGAALTLVLAIWHWGISSHYNDVLDCVLAIACVVFGIGLLAVLCCIPINRLDTKAEIEQFRATQNTLVEIRAADWFDKVSPYEIAAIQQKVVEANRWLANAKYYAAHPLTNWFYPQEIFKLKPIK